MLRKSRTREALLDGQNWAIAATRQIVERGGRLIGSDEVIEPAGPASQPGEPTPVRAGQQDHRDVAHCRHLAEGAPAGDGLRPGVTEIQIDDVGRLSADGLDRGLDTGRDRHAIAVQLELHSVQLRQVRIAGNEEDVDRLLVIQPFGRSQVKGIPDSHELWSLPGLNVCAYEQKELQIYEWIRSLPTSVAARAGSRVRMWVSRATSS